jgi:hypothetical protein
MELLRLKCSQHQKTLLSRYKPCNLALYIKLQRTVNKKFSKYASQNAVYKDILPKFFIAILSGSPIQINIPQYHVKEKEK